MLMKVFNKGQVVIPSEIRKGLGIVAGDFVEVTLDLPHKRIELRPHKSNSVSSLAGSLAPYAHRKPFPGKQKMASILRESLIHES
jgi:AbrB family looped-hinge helix DNA binding protein